MPAGPASSRAAGGTTVRLGLKPNLAQIALLVGINALVGGMIGQERTVLPLLAADTFHLSASIAALTYIVAFGLTKAVTNLAAGSLSERHGRRPVLIAGWLVGLPVPALLIWAPTWDWIIAANVLLGVNQGLCWSTTVNMKIDLAGPASRGLVIGLNEAAGYLALAVTAILTAEIADRTGLRPEPFYLGVAYAVLGLVLSATLVRETRGHAQAEAASLTTSEGPDAQTALSFGHIVWLTSVRDRAMSAASQAGLVNNLNDALAWGIFPLLFAGRGLSIAQIGLLVAAYPAVWGLGQSFTGWLSDRVGRRPLVVVGMFLEAVALALVALGSTFQAWLLAQILLGVGKALVYPTLIAVVGDVAHPDWRARAVGIYRFWRDSGFAIGALLAGGVAGAFGLEAAIWVVAAITTASAIVVLLRMGETLPGRGGQVHAASGDRSRV